MRCHPDPALGILAALALLHTSTAQDPQGPEFELHQPELFADGGALTNAFADYDNDGDLDLFAQRLVVHVDDGLSDLLLFGIVGEAAIRRAVQIVDLTVLME